MTAIAKTIRTRPVTALAAQLFLGVAWRAFANSRCDAVPENLEEGISAFLAADNQGEKI